MDLDVLQIHRRARQPLLKVESRFHRWSNTHTDEMNVFSIGRVRSERRYFPKRYVMECKSNKN
jgi:hypothetical protein